MENIPTVKDYMATKLFTLKPGDDIYKAVNFLLEHQVSGAPVVDDEHKLIGIISEKDCLYLLTNRRGNKVSEVNVGDFMSKKVETISPDLDIFSVAEIFIKKSYRRLPVVDKADKLVGQISRRDILKAIKQNIKSDKFRIIDVAKAKLIEKEEISKLKFPKKEVLNSEESRKIRAIKLRNATRLGNIEHYKVKIIFEDKEGVKMVYTTVWHSTERFVSLKGGITIPVHRVHEVNIF